MPYFIAACCFDPPVWQVKTLVSSVLKQHGRIDFLVNNGGGQFSSPAEHMTSKGWKAVIDTNLTGTFHCCKEGKMQTANTLVHFLYFESSQFDCLPFFPHSLHRVDETARRCDRQHHRRHVERLPGHGVSSTASWIYTHTLSLAVCPNTACPLPDSHTGAARSAVDNLTKSLAIEWASSGVRVNSVAPVSTGYKSMQNQCFGSLTTP